jgi:hypothetical protein
MRIREVLQLKNDDGQTESERVRLSAVQGAEGSENAEWSKRTPAAEFTITINNPDAFGTGHHGMIDPARGGKS